MRFPVADGHCDYLDKIDRFGYDLDAPKPAQSIRLAEMQQGGVALQFFAAWLDTEAETPPLNQYLSMLYHYERMLAAHPAAMGALGKNFDFSGGRIATVFTIEDLGAVPDCLQLLPAFRHFGAKAATLTWNYNNPVAGSSMDEGNLGLSPYGREVFREMERLHIAVDVSHLSDRGIDDLLCEAKNPVFASHSNARSVMPVPRALSDEHIRGIAQMGGTVGVNFCNEHLTKAPQPCMDDVVAHILHICEVGGVDCCAIGSDFDGIDLCPVGLVTSTGMQALGEALIRAGLSEGDVRKVLFENLYRYILRFV